MKMIYHPRGRAGEYADYAVNLYRGCGFRCSYCFAPSVLKVSREEFANPKPRQNILETIQKDADEMVDKKYGNSVFMCFSCDPYQPLEQEKCLTRDVIKILHRRGITVMILTKAGVLATRDFDILWPGDMFGQTLTCLDPAESQRWEPFAALPVERMNNLIAAKVKGIQTWVSLEPVLNPETTLEIIRRTHKYVNMYKVGKLNYSPLAAKIDWGKFGREAKALLDSLGNKYYIKKDLKEYMEK